MKFGNWIILGVVIVGMFFLIPRAIEQFFKITFEAPYEAQQKAIQKANKTEDTASGIKGTSINNIPYNNFEKVLESLKSTSPEQFKSVDIQIPKIYVTSPMFNTDKKGDDLQDIWMSAINEGNLREQYGNYRVFYDKNLINDNGDEYSSEDAGYEQLNDMKEIIVSEIGSNNKFKDYQFKKWYTPKGGHDTAKASGRDNLYNFSAVIEIKDLKPNLIFGVSTKKVTAQFKTEPKLQLIKNSLEIK